MLILTTGFTGRFCVFLGALALLAFPCPGFAQAVGPSGAAAPAAQIDSAAASPAPPDEIVFESSVGRVLFPHDLHEKMRCTRCHHQIQAAALDTPHEDYLTSSWINCQTCHNTGLETGKQYYKCSDCHHAAPVNIADETLSSKVVIHKSCWKCHKTGTGVKASEGCGKCHVKNETLAEAANG